MTHPLEIVASVIVVALAATLVWPNGVPLPRPKPAEFVEPLVVRIEPMTTQQRVDAVAVELRETRSDLEEITRAVKQKQAEAAKDDRGGM